MIFSNIFKLFIISSIFWQLLGGFCYYLYGFVEIADYKCCWVCWIVMLSLVDSSLSKKRIPSNIISSSNISPRIISHHKKHPIRLPLPHFMLNKPKSFNLRFPIINMLNQAQLMPLTMLIKNIIKRSKCNSRFKISTSPYYIILCSII